MRDEVLELGREVNYLRQSLDHSEKTVGYLKRRLNYHENREEEELVSDSITYSREKDVSRRMRKYSAYAPRNFGGSKRY